MSAFLCCTCLRFGHSRLYIRAYFVHLDFGGYILEGEELEFYMKKLQKKKGKAAGGA